MEQQLFDVAPFTRPTLPVIGEQKDIRYYATRARSILNRPEATGMDFWSINPYVGCALGCAYCYARYAHGYALERAAAANPDHARITEDLRSFEPWLAFERRVFVKENAPDLLRAALRSGSRRHEGLIKGEWVSVGTATDPYQPAERHFRVTRRVLEVLAEHPNLHVTIITKSPLVTRDIDVMRRIMRHSTLHVHVSLITVDRELARRLEPRAPTPHARLSAIKRLHDAGVTVGVNVMPILPGITDGTSQLSALVRAVRETGADSIAACALRLRSAARKRYLPFIDAEFPSLSNRYRATYARDAHAGEAYREGLSRVMRRLCEKYGVSYGGRDDDEPEDEDEQQNVADQLEIQW